MKNHNIKRNELDYILTDTMPVEISELFSYKYFYDFLDKNQDILSKIEEATEKNIQKLSQPFSSDWATTPLKYNIMKKIGAWRELNIMQPISAINVYFFIKFYQKSLMNMLETNACFSLRYHKKNTNLYYKSRKKKTTNYFNKVAKKIDNRVIQQTGQYFKIYKFNS